jgi:serine/threonine protein kinase
VARLVHPNAVQVYCVGQARGYHFIALEYVDGQSLAEMLTARGRVSWLAALEIVRQCTLALIRAHALGVVHRDIKPANILVNRHADVKLADFGLARLDGDPAITEHGSVLGTPLYMSPEQARGEAVGPATDLYSLGCVLYHMLCGRPPFIGEEPANVLFRHVRERPRPPQEYSPGLPPPVCDLVMRLLAKETAKRPASARALSADIAGARRGTDWDASRRDDDSRVAASPAPGPGLSDSVRGVILSREGVRELLAMEATCACLRPRPRRAFLEATMRNYRISREKMLPLLEKPFFTRRDVWDLQALKRSAEGKDGAVTVISKLRRLETELGCGLLQACAESRRQLETPWAG